jgi:hypothetical protein
MKIGRPINQLSAGALRRLIPLYRKYTDFNRLGLFRGIIESQKLELKEKLELRDLGKATFTKYYDFLVVKDPHTWAKLENLGVTRTRQDEVDDWRKIQKKQQEILSRKRFGHRNFGVNSRHDCGYEHCKLNNAMTRAKGPNRYGSEIWFKQDTNKQSKKEQNLVRQKEKRQRAWLEEDTWS